MMRIPGDFNGRVGTAETGEEESVGGFGWVTRDRKGRELKEGAFHIKSIKNLHERCRFW